MLKSIDLPRITDTLKSIAIDNAATMFRASLPPLNARILLLQGRDLRVHSKANDTLGALVGRDPSKELEPRGIVLRLHVQVRTLFVDDSLILSEAQLSFLASLVDLARSLALRTDHSRLRPGVKFIVVAVVEAAVPRQLRQRTFDLGLHFQLPEDVEAEVIASYGYFVPCRGECQFCCVIELTSWKQSHLWHYKIVLDKDVPSCIPVLVFLCIGC